MKVNLKTIYSQFDPQWKDKLLGFNTEPQFNFYNYGCLIADLAMVAQYYGRAVDPSQLNDLLMALAPKDSSAAAFRNGGEYVNGKFNQLFPEIQEIPVPTAELLTDEQMGEIRSSLDQGFPVILGIDYNPQTLKFDSHFVVAVDYNAQDENDITVADPLGGRVHSLKDYLSGGVNSARKSIWKYFVMKGNVPISKDQTVSNPVGSPALAAAPAAPALPDNFKQIIHKSTQWDKTSGKYLPEIKPEDSSFELLEGKLAANVRTVEVEKIVEKEVIKEVPAPIREREGLDKEWAQVVEYLEVKKTPDEASFEDVKRVVAGIKSRETDAKNQATKAKEEAAIAASKLGTAEEEVRSLKAQLLQQIKLEKARIDSLKQAQPSFDKLTRHYEAALAEARKIAEARLEELRETRVDLAVKAVEEKSEGDIVKARRSVSFPLSGVVEAVKRIFVIRW